MNNASRQAVFRLRDFSDIIMARRAGTDLANKLGFDKDTAPNVAAIITEAATNIIRHAVQGEVIIRAVSRGALKGIEILAIDAGPGMHYPGAAMAAAADRSERTGLYLISQLATEFDMFSAQGKGTVLWIQVWQDSGAASLPVWDIGVICLPAPTEEECGDAWEAIDSVNGLSIMVADGLGHGPDAALASQAAIESVQQTANRSPADIIHRAHHALQRTRGAAVAISHVDEVHHQIEFAGIGNISAQVITNGVCRHMMSHNGIVGSNLRKVEQLAFPWATESMLIMQSDGVGARWNLNDYLGLFERHPALIAAVLYRDFLRPHDDATVVVVRRRRLN